MVILLTASCKLIPKEEAEQKTAQTVLQADPHSFSRPEKALVKHLDLDMYVDFEQKIISAKAAWTFDNITKGDSIIFDTRDLQIERVTIGDEQRPTSFKLGTTDLILGAPLSIKIDSSARKVNIYYTTSPKAAALQWLTPQQTAGKVQPFLFTQSEAVLGRTWIPSYDAPGVRFTYDARVKVPKNLLALMSAENPQQKNDSGIYHFTQPHPVPSYLVALAVGDITFKSIDNRTGVYAEPSVINKAAYEFADMGKMVAAAEKLYGPYRWGRYDLLVLPPSFPFGGMENPMLTFATPTVLAGDRSLVSLVAHELAHSWSGNLVTNSSWNDFWLNEGFTMYFERRITEALYGKEEREMQEVAGFNDLKNSLADFGNTNEDTKLKLNLNGRDPDLGVSDIAYEKGYLFLKNLEETVGRPALDYFLLKYFNGHAFQSMNTENFIAYLKQNLPAALKINIDEWVYKPGLPEKIPVLQSARFNKIDSLIVRYDSAKSTRTAEAVNVFKNDINTTNERLYLLNHLPQNINVSDMQALDQTFGFTQSHNAEVQFAWYLQAIRHQYTAAYPFIENFLVNVGRRKFVMPLYKEMSKTPEGKSRAVEIYKKARQNYHSVTYRSVDELLNITNEK
ncbi:M1 family metallopeptidase [soil metagenome]